MKTKFLTGLGIACICVATVTFAKMPQTNFTNFKQQNFADTTPHKMHMKAKNKSTTVDSVSGSGMYNTSNTADSSTSRTSTGDYNNSSKSGDSTTAKPPKF